mmetsp:Transcript_23930/g.52085  ORF Transcript_23930/g.52085 Transcript_23930/m.52085 type:complete len:215 (+) Transcript_23930:1503-2147(+)
MCGHWAGDCTSTRSRSSGRLASSWRSSSEARAGSPSRPSRGCPKTARRTPFAGTPGNPPHIGGPLGGVLAHRNSAGRRSRPLSRSRASFDVPPRRRGARSPGRSCPPTSRGRDSSAFRTRSPQSGRRPQTAGAPRRTCQNPPTILPPRTPPSPRALPSASCSRFPPRQRRGASNLAARRCAVVLCLLPSTSGALRSFRSLRPRRRFPSRRPGGP